MSRPRTWTDERIERVLRELCAGARVFPSRGEFAAAGRHGLYSTLERRGELNAWAARIGLKRRAPPAALASQATRVLWTDDRVERTLREVCAGRERFPSNRELIQAGLGGLYARLHRRGELDVWAARLGLARNRAAWTDDEIQCALDGLCDGLERFPTREQFRDAGLESLHGVLQARGELECWARRLGLARRRRWNDATIAAALGELCAGRKQFPTAREFRGAGLGGLYSILGHRGELDRWARQLELPRRQYRRSKDRAWT